MTLTQFDVFFVKKKMFRKNKDKITDWRSQPLRGVGNFVLSFLNAMKMLRTGGACSPFDPLTQILHVRSLQSLSSLNADWKVNCDAQTVREISKMISIKYLINYHLIYMLASLADDASDRQIGHFGERSEPILHILKMMMRNLT